MNERFGDELSLDEILSDEEKAVDAFIRSAPGSNFGPELTLSEVIAILQQTNLPPRATFWEKNNQVVQEAIHSHQVNITIDDYTFKIEYFAKITSTQKFDFSTPMSYIQFYPNGKGQNDSQSSCGDSSTTGSDSNSDV